MRVSFIFSFACAVSLLSLNSSAHADPRANAKHMHPAGSSVDSGGPSQDSPTTYTGQQPYIQHSIGSGGGFEGVIYKGEGTSPSMPIQQPPKPAQQRVMDPFQKDNL